MIQATKDFFQSKAKLTKASKEFFDHIQRERRTIEHTEIIQAHNASYKIGLFTGMIN
jgi:hypothetical protein